MTNQRIRCGQVRPLLFATVVAVLLAACVPAPAVPPMATPSPAVTPAQSATPTPRPDGLSPEQAATLAGLRKVDDYPLYTMRYQAGRPRWRLASRLQPLQSPKGMLRDRPTATSSSLRRQASQWLQRFQPPDEAGTVDVVMGRNYGQVYTFQLGER